MIDLEIIWGGKSHQVQLDDGEHGVGRAHDNPVQIADARVSKYHAVIRVDGNRLFVHDLGSTNGTEVDGTPVGKDEIEVSSHSTVRFAGASVRRKEAGATTTHHFLRDDDELSSKLSYNVSQGYSDIVDFVFETEIFPVLTPLAVDTSIIKQLRQFHSRDLPLQVLRQVLP